MNELNGARENFLAQVKGAVNQCRKSALADHGATKAQIAKNCGVDVSVISRWLLDPRYMELGNLGVLSAVCGLEISFKAVDQKTGRTF